VPLPRPYPAQVLPGVGLPDHVVRLGEQDRTFGGEPAEGLLGGIVDVGLFGGIGA
jgi:hypothetical protein